MADSAAPVSAPTTTGGSIALSPAVVGGRKMKKVSAKTIKRTLKKLGMKPKGRVVIKGGEMDEMAAPSSAPTPAAAGKRGKKTHKKGRSASRRKSLGVFGL